MIIPAYIGPGLATGTLVLVIVVIFLLLLSIGYLVWMKVKDLLKKFTKKN